MYIKLIVIDTQQIHFQLSECEILKFQQNTNKITCTNIHTYNFIE